MGNDAQVKKKEEERKRKAEEEKEKEERRIRDKKAEEIKKAKENEMRKKKEEKEISNKENIKEESKQLQQKEVKKIDKKNETNQINNNYQKVFNDNKNIKNMDNNNIQNINNNKNFRPERNNTKYIKHNKKNEDLSLTQRCVNICLTNKDNDNIKKEKNENEQSAIIFDNKNKTRNKVNEIEKEKDKEDEEENLDTKYYLNRKKNLLFKSLYDNFPKMNNNNLMINKAEQAKNENENEKEIDNKMNLQIKKDDNFSKNKIINQIENNEQININFNVIMKEVENKINEIKLADNNIIKEVEKMRSKEKENKENNGNSNNPNIDKKIEENRININKDLNDNNNNLNINRIINNNEVKNKPLTDNNNSNYNTNNLNRNDNLLACNEFLRINFNLKTNDLYNYMIHSQYENLENNNNNEILENKENLVGNENIIFNENQEDLSNSPNYFSVLQSINIFNSVLIILNNVSFVIDYFSFNVDNIIQNYKLNNPYCLTKIVYYINKYLWKTDGYLNISENHIIEKYQDYITHFCEFNNINNSQPQNYCYDPRNSIKIYNFIYDTINSELTRVNGPKMNNNYNNYDPKLLRYLNNINRTCNSILSENFMGLYRYQTYCDYCMQRVKSYGFHYNYDYDYQAFYEITFNLSEINYYYKYKDSFQLAQRNAGFNNNFNNVSQNIHLDQCFDYTFNKHNKIALIEYCDSCFLNRNKSRYNLIYSPPNILTLILTNNEYNENFKFLFQDELNIKKYIINSNNNGVYLLISCLCRHSNTGNYICYCINPKDSYWYIYSDVGINRVEEIDENAIPLILFYQTKSTISFEYKNIMIINELYEICLNIKFSNGMQPKNFTFNKESTIKKIIEKILSTINLIGAKGSLLINGQNAIEKEKLSKYLEKNNNVLLVIKS